MDICAESSFFVEYTAVFFPIKIVWTSDSHCSIGIGLMFFKNMLKTLHFWRIAMTNQLAVVTVKQCIWEGKKGAIAPNHHYLCLSIQISPGTHSWIKGTPFSARRQRVGRFISYPQFHPHWIFYILFLTQTLQYLVFQILLPNQPHPVFHATKDIQPARRDVSQRHHHWLLASCPTDSKRPWAF